VCGGCTAYGFFGAPAANEPGGMHVFDSQGYLYFVSFTAGLSRVPPGGGTVEVVVSNATVGYNYMAGSVYVLADDTVLFQGPNTILRYHPTTKTYTTFAAAPETNDKIGMGILADAAGNVIALRKNQVFDKNGNPLGTVPWAGDFMVFSSTWTYVMGNTHNYVLEECFDGTDNASWPSPIGSFSDGAGLAMGADGSLYFGQGNTNPATIYKLGPAGGVPTLLTGVPMDVLGLEIDPTGTTLYASGAGDFNTVWAIDVASGSKVVYGCDPNSARKCGATN
jgi:hypothetical protein